MDNKLFTKKFTISFIIFVIICLCVTGGVLYYNFKEEKDLDKDKTNKVVDEHDLAITSFNELYNENSIEIKEIEKGSELDEVYTKYIQISGLKNKKIENEINKRIKDIVDGMNKDYISAYVYGNFSNILSIVIYGRNNDDNDYLEERLNIDLTTGNDITIDQVFTNSSPIGLYVANAYYEDLAWEDNMCDGIDYDDSCSPNNNMDNVDASGYEDEMLKIVRKFQDKINELKFSISPSGLHIDGLETDQYMLVELSKHKENVAIYKRFLTDESIYENDEYGTKNIVVFTNNYGEDNEYIVLGDNIYIEKAQSYVDEDFPLNIRNTVDDIVDSISNDLKSYMNDGNGYIFQVHYNIRSKTYENVNSDGFYADISVYKVKSTLQYYKNGLFEDYVGLDRNVEVNPVFYYSTDNYVVDITEYTYNIDSEGNTNLISSEYFEPKYIEYIEEEY